MLNKKPKIIVAMSGGLDSSIAAWLLQKKGYEVFGIFLRLTSSDEQEEAARRVCRYLNIKFYPINLRAKFKQKIINYFLDSYACGLTPNPCIKCNYVIKFGELLRIARELDINLLATGHYVRKKTTKIKGKIVYRLFRAKDKSKDQSYFLYRLNQKQLAHTIFPLGDYLKSDLKKIAQKNNIPYFQKESQDICFLQENGHIIDHKIFLQKHLKLKPGPIKLLGNNKIIGKHKGLPLYTVGQRKGVEVGGIGPFYVAGFDYKKNILYVVPGDNLSALWQKEFKVNELNWIGGPPKFPLACQVMIRYRHQAAECIVDINKKNKNQCIIKLKRPERAITPGQSAVFYNKDEVLGGGIIV